MDENEFWIVVWKVIAALVVLVSITIAGCNVYTEQIRKDVIKFGLEQGIDPIRLMCGMQDSFITEEAMVCQILAIKEGEEK